MILTRPVTREQMAEALVEAARRITPGMLVLQNLFSDQSGERFEDLAKILIDVLMDEDRDGGSE